MFENIGTNHQTPIVDSYCQGHCVASCALLTESIPPIHLRFAYDVDIGAIDLCSGHYDSGII